MSEWTSESIINEPLKEWMKEWMNEWMNERMCEWTKGNIGIAKKSATCFSYKNNNESST